MALQYQVGDTGPAGGIIFATPLSPNNPTNLTFEAALEDICNSAGPDMWGPGPGNSQSNYENVIFSTDPWWAYHVNQTVINITNTAGNYPITWWNPTGSGGLGTFPGLWIAAHAGGTCIYDSSAQPLWSQEDKDGPITHQCVDKYGSVKECTCGTGAEWGGQMATEAVPWLSVLPNVYAITGPNQSANRLMGAGRTNTATHVAFLANAIQYPPASTAVYYGHSFTIQGYFNVNDPNNPVHMTTVANEGHVIASELCDKFFYGGYSDWYLGSVHEMQELMTSLRSNPYVWARLNIKDNCYNDDGNPKAIPRTPANLCNYWTSTEAFTRQHGVTVDSRGDERYYKKCHTYRVRPIRSFVDTGNVITPIQDNDYNYRDGAAAVSANPKYTPIITPGLAGSGGGVADGPLDPDWGSWMLDNYGVSIDHTATDSMIGWKNWRASFAETDAMGNTVNFTWGGSIYGPFIVTIRDKEKRLLGKWKYSHASYHISNPHSIVDGSFYNDHAPLSFPNLPKMRKYTFYGFPHLGGYPEHLEGDYPFLIYGHKTSTQIDAATGHYIDPDGFLHNDDRGHHPFFTAAGSPNIYNGFLKIPGAPDVDAPTVFKPVSFGYYNKDFEGTTHEITASYAYLKFYSPLFSMPNGWAHMYGDNTDIDHMQMVCDDTKGDWWRVNTNMPPGIGMNGYPDNEIRNHGIPGGGGLDFGIIWSSPHGQTYPFTDPNNDQNPHFKLAWTHSEWFRPYWHSVTTSNYHAWYAQKTPEDLGVDTNLTLHGTLPQQLKLDISYLPFVAANNTPMGIGNFFPTCSFTDISNLFTGGGTEGTGDPRGGNGGEGGEERPKKHITSFEIVTSDLPQETKKRKLTVKGDPGAVFNITIETDDTTVKYYNWQKEVTKTVRTSTSGGSTKIKLIEETRDLVAGQEVLKTSTGLSGSPTITSLSGNTVVLSVAQNLNETDTITFKDSSTFTTTYKRLNREKIDESGVFTRDIIFPEESANTVYTVTIQAMNSAQTDLKLNGIKSKRSTTKTISQYVDTRTTFSLASAGSSAHYNTLPSNYIFDSAPTSSGRTNPIREKISWNVTLSANSFNIIRQPVASDFTTTTTQTVNGSTSSSTSLVLDSVEGLYVDMLTSLSSRTITAIDTDTKTLTLSGTASASDGATVTFTGYGSLGTASIAGTNFNVGDFTVTLDDVTTKVNGATSSSTSVVVDSSDGIKAASTTTVKGIGIDCSTEAPHVDNVAGTTLTLSAAQTLEDDVDLTFTGSSRSATITAVLTITEVGTKQASTTTTLQLDNILNVS
jgi:hypothetical protein